MITREELPAMDDEGIVARAGALTSEDIRLLVELLDEKADVVRYHALLLLERRSGLEDDVYPHIGVFIGKLASANSYQRNIGAMLMAANAAWDADNRIDAAIGDYLALLQDEKPITVRQCLQALPNIIRHKPALRGDIAERLLSFDLSGVRETMRKSILTDILGAFIELRKFDGSNEIENYIKNALSGGILDKKGVREVEAMMK